MALLALTLALAGLAVGPANPIALDGATGVAAAASGDQTINTSVSYEWDPHSDGDVRVELAVPAVEVEDGAEFDIEGFDSDATVVDATGFETDGYEWTLRDESATSTLTYRLSIENGSNGWFNGRETFASFEPQLDDEADVGSDDYELNHSRSVVGDGVARDDWIVVGNLTVATFNTGNGGTIELFSPAGVESPSLWTIGSQLADANVNRWAADVDEHVLGLATPGAGSSGHAWDRRFVVGPSLAADTYSNTWMHEYFHTLDPLVPEPNIDDGDEVDWASNMTWYWEGYAEYGADLATLQQGYGQFGEFRQDALTANRTRALSEQEDTGNPINYKKGSFVISAIDYQIRRSSDGLRTYQFVVDEIDQEEHLTLEEYLDIVAQVGNETIADRAEEWITNDTAPEMWGVDAHQSVYGDVAYLNVTPTYYRVADGDRREVELTSNTTFYPNQSLTIAFDVTGEGNLAGERSVNSTLYATDPFEEVASHGVEVSLQPDESTVVEQTAPLPHDAEYELLVQNDVIRFDTTTVEAINGSVPTDPDGDGRYEDINANGKMDLADVVDFHQHNQSAAVQNHVPAYDFDGDGDVDSDDTDALMEEV